VLIHHHKHALGDGCDKKAYGSAWIDHDGYSPMFYAVFKGYADVVALMIDVENIDVDDITIGTIVHRFH
jgi:hypothetical protein